MNFKLLTVGQLKEQLKDIDDDVVLVVPSEDHSYIAASFSSPVQAVKEGAYMGEYYGEELRSAESLIDVIVIS